MTFSIQQEFKDIFRFLGYFLKIFAFSTMLEIVMYSIESDYLNDFLKNNLLTILLAFLAINTATLGVIASKIQEVASKYNDFRPTKTIKEMLFSLKEQVYLLILSILILVVQDSEKIYFLCSTIILNAALTGVFIYSISILWDTGKSVFVLTDLSK